MSRVQFSVPGESMAYLIIYGPTPEEILRKYTGLLGRPALPPPWSFDLWLSTSFATSYDETTAPHRSVDRQPTRHGRLRPWRRARTRRRDPTGPACPKCRAST